MTDIRPYGAGEALGYYWVRRSTYAGRAASSTVELVAIDALGNVTATGVRGDDDPAAPTEQEAVLQHLGAGIKEADAKLERRRREAPEQEPEKPAPRPDPATEKFFDDADY